jgi:hypothetical protein
VLAQALDDGADAVVILGARQSNAARATAAAAARLGLACHLVVDGDEPGEPEGNLLLDRLFGATVHPSGARDWVALDARAQALRTSCAPAARRRTGCRSGPRRRSGARLRARVRGARRAAQRHRGRGDLPRVELGRHPRRPARRPRARRGQTGSRIGGAVDVGGTGPDMVGLIRWLAGEGRVAHRRERSTWSPTSTTTTSGPGYAETTPESLEGDRAARRDRGRRLRPRLQRQGARRSWSQTHDGAASSGPVVFWHTGGVPAIFARPYAGALADVARSPPPTKPSALR